MVNTKRLREVLDHAEAWEDAPGVAWGSYILNFNDIRKLAETYDLAQQATQVRDQFEQECG